MDFSIVCLSKNHHFKASMSGLLGLRKQDTQGGKCDKIPGNNVANKKKLNELFYCPLKYKGLESKCSVGFDAQNLYIWSSPMWSLSNTITGRHI